MKKYGNWKIFSMLVLIFVSGTATGFTDEIGGQYLDKQRNINNKSRQLHLDLRLVQNKLSFNSDKSLLETKFRGTSSLGLKVDELKLEQEKNRIESNINELEKQKEDLVLDAFKFYKGKEPYFYKTWLDAELKHLDWVLNNTKETNNEIQKRQNKTVNN